jgi:hypothetical protein
VRTADVALCQSSSIETWWSIVDESCALVNKGKVSGVEVGWLSHRQAIQSLIALSALIKLVDGVQYRQVEHIASFRPLFALTSADGVRPVDVSSY